MNIMIDASKHSTQNELIHNHKIDNFDTEVSSIYRTGENDKNFHRELSIESAPRPSRQCVFLSKLKTLQNNQVLLKPTMNAGRLFPNKPSLFRIPSKNPLSTLLTERKPAITSSQLKASFANINSHLTLPSKNHNCVTLASKKQDDSRLGSIRSDRSIPKLHSDLKPLDLLLNLHKKASTNDETTTAFLTDRGNMRNSLHGYLNCKLDKPIYLPAEEFKRLSTEKIRHRDQVKPILKSVSKNEPPTKTSVSCSSKVSLSSFNLAGESSPNKKLKRVSFSRNRFVKFFNPRSSDDSQQGQND